MAYEALDVIIAEGMYYMRLVPPGLVIFGRVTRSPYPEDKETEEGLIRAGHWPVKAYSTGCPEGESGTEQADEMIPITEELFKEAEALRWEPSAELQQRLLAHIDMLVAGGEA